MLPYFSFYDIQHIKMKPQFKTIQSVILIITYSYYYLFLLLLITKAKTINWQTCIAYLATSTMAKFEVIYVMVEILLVESPVGVSQIGLFISRIWNSIRLDFLPAEFEILPDLTFYHDIYIPFNIQLVIRSIDWFFNRILVMPRNMWTWLFKGQKQIVKL